MDSAPQANFFESGSDAFPRALPDNCVEYALFVIDTLLEPRALLSELEKVRKAAQQLCDELTGGYIWQRDVFQLQVKTHDGLTYLHGTTDYGDSVEDEWLVVYLLRRLTTSFPHLWARVSDSSDGEFLLIEAANNLPAWLNPEVDGGRVWLHQGKLRILPLSATNGETKRPLSLHESVAFLKSRPEQALHSESVESEAFYRLEKYPGQIQDSMHHCSIPIPKKLATLLHHKPAIIAPAIEAFYLRVPAAMKPLASSSPDALHFPPHDLVTVSVRFTKVLFAQLRSQRFTPPQIWSPILEAAEKDSAKDPEAKGHERTELGMKLTSGFEILAATAESQDNRLAREFSYLLEDLEEDGDEALPSDEVIKAWPDVARDDDESWLDIDFEDFENELRGNRGPTSGPRKGFGDASTQADLRKMVSRFEAFLNDESAGLEGVDMDDMDQDDDVSDDDEVESEDDENKEVHFDEDQFGRMMREMMGLSAGGDARTTQPFQAGHKAGDEDILQLASQMEAELKGHGALQLDPALKDEKRLMGKESANEKAPEEDENSEGEVDIDYNLAKNLMESFKGQAGMAGPAGNMLGMMGIRLPRDEDEGEEY